MLKIVSSVLEQSSLYVNHECNNFLSNAYKYQCVRWKRKPWWLPTAKSKLFRVPERKRLPEPEREELKRLWNNYRTEMKSINAYMAEKLQQSMTGPDVIAEQARLEEEDHMNCIKLNDEWNEQVRLIREERIKIEKDKDMEEVIREMVIHDIEEAERKAAAEAMVREEKEKSKYYITSDNIDAAIEEALSKEVDFNFAIDLECNIYEGRLTKPADNNDKDQKVVQAN